VAPVSGGNNNTSVEPVTTFEQAARAARERLRHSVNKFGLTVQVLGGSK
jgi:hypothetical protein